ncbi:MAG TPA: tetratricopeptide repeat protein [Xanthobacteraceae bacterium]|nr:tetratricopeptide repeat protein [Xanthobacteraceae bacterium]
MKEPRSIARTATRLGAAVAFSLSMLSAANAQIPRSFELRFSSHAGSYLAARVAGAARDMSAASTFYRSALRADPANADLIERTFLVTLASGQVEEAVQLAESVVTFDKTHRIARLALAARAIKVNQFAQARAHLTQAVQGPIADLTATLLSGWAWYGSGNVKTAVAHIDKLSGPEWYAVFKDLHAGLMLDLAKQRNDAIKRLERVRSFDPNSLRNIDAYARILSRAGRTEEAEKAYGEFSRSLARHPLVDTAVSELKAGKTLAPLAANAAAGASEALYGLGAALSQQGGEDLGMIYLQLAIYLNPEHPLALVALGDLFETLKKYDLAIDTYDRVPDSSPLRRKAQIQRALNLDILDKKDEARERLAAIVQDMPNDIEGLFAYGNVLRANKRYTEACDVYTRLLKEMGEPKREHWSIYYFRGICFERSKQWPLAEKDLQQALKLFPDQPQVLNYLGYSWVDQGINLDEALEMIRKAVTLRPKDGYIIDSLGWAYYRLGRYQEATVELERAVELTPNDPTINDHLGDVYWKTDRKLEARFQWSHALEMKPEPDELEKIQRKLKEGLIENPAPPRAEDPKNPDKG